MRPLPTPPPRPAPPRPTWASKTNAYLAAGSRAAASVLHSAGPRLWRLRLRLGRGVGLGVRVGVGVGLGSTRAREVGVRRPCERAAPGLGHCRNSSSGDRRQ